MTLPHPQPESPGWVPTRRCTCHGTTEALTSRRSSNEFNTTGDLYCGLASQTPEQDDDGNIADLRDEYPSGWRVLTQHESVGFIIDALLDAPDYHFSKSKLSEHAGVSRQSVHTHLPLLRRLDIVQAVEDSSPETYTLNSDSALVSELHRLNGLVNAKLDDE